MIKYALIDDAAISLGGTSLTLDAITEPFKHECEIISSKDLCRTHLQFKHPKVWIIGNTLGLNKESYETLITILQTKKTVKIDFDYGFCKYRGPTPHRILGKKECDCGTNPQTLSLKNIYTLIHRNSSVVFYMSEQQRQIHKTLEPFALRLEAMRLPALEFQKQMQEAMRPIAMFQTNMLASMRPLLDQHAQMQKSFEPLALELAKLPIGEIESSIRTFAELSNDEVDIEYVDSEESGYSVDGEFVSIEDGKANLHDVKTSANQIELTIGQKQYLRYVYVKTVLHVREDAYIHSEVVDFLHPGTVIVLVQKDKNWSYVTYQNPITGENESGWVFSRYLKKFN